MIWPPTKKCEQVLQTIINNILIRVWLSQSNYPTVAGSEQQSACDTILPLQGLEEEEVITIDKANLLVF